MDKAQEILNKIKEGGLLYDRTTDKAEKEKLSNVLDRLSEIYQKEISKGYIGKSCSYRVGDHIYFIKVLEKSKSENSYYVELFDYYKPYNEVKLYNCFTSEDNLPKGLTIEYTEKYDTIKKNFNKLIESMVIYESTRD